MKKLVYITTSLILLEVVLLSVRLYNPIIAFSVGSLVLLPMLLVYSFKDRTSDDILLLSKRIERLELLSNSDSRGETEEVRDVILVSIGYNKINLSRVLREVTGSSLKKTMDVLNDTPRIILMDVPLDKAEVIRNSLEEHGATVNLRKIR